MEGAAARPRHAIKPATRGSVLISHRVLDDPPTQTTFTTRTVRHGHHSPRRVRTTATGVQRAVVLTRACVQI